MMKILFLCHGNICRSPMAEFIFKDKISKKGRVNDFEVASKALTSEELGADIYPPAKDCLTRHSIPFTKRKVTKFNMSDYDYYDKIYIMDDSNYRIISRMTDDPLHKIEFLNDRIEDPWYSGEYDKVFDEISEGIDNILSKY